MTPFATYIIETLVTLLAVIAVAILALVGARRLGVGRATGPLQLVGRLPLEGRRAVYLIRVSNRLFVLGASEAGLEKIAELESSHVEFAEEPRLSFRQALSQVLQRSGRDRTENARSHTDGGSDAGK